MSNYTDRIIEQDRATFAQRLRVALAVADMTSSALATACAVSPASVTKWTKGRAIPDAIHMAKIAEVTGSTVEWLTWPRTIEIQHRRANVSVSK